MTQHTPTGLLWAALALLVTAGPEVTGAEKEGIITVECYDTFGEPTPECPVQAEDASGRVVALDKPLPYGTYNLSVKGWGMYQSWTSSVGLAEPEVLVVVGRPLQIGDSIYVENVVQAQVTGYPSDCGAFARVVAVYGTTIRDQRVSASGSFRIEALQSGLYELLIVKNGRVLGETQFKVGVWEGRIAKATLRLPAGACTDRPSKPKERQRHR